MIKYSKSLFLMLLARLFVSVIILPVSGKFSAIAEGGILLICSVIMLVLCYKNRHVIADGVVPTLKENFISTVTFSGLLLTSYPLTLLVHSMLPTLSLKSNAFNRISVGLIGGMVLCLVCALCLLFSSVVNVKLNSFELNRKTIAFGGAIFVLIGMSFQGILSDFIFGCFITAYLIRFGSVAVAGVYIILYKLINLLLEFSIYMVIGEVEVSFVSALPGIFGTLCLFGSVLILGIYLDLRYVEFKRKLPILTAFVVPGIILAAVIGYFTLNYVKI